MSKMGNVQLAVAILCVIAILIIAFFVFFHSLDFIGWIQAWIQSNKEEKASLTRLKGHYNANGYLVHSDSDIQLNCSTGSFKRFDSVDRDFRISLATTSLTDEWNSPPVDSSIPPHLRPAPVPTYDSLNASTGVEEQVAKIKHTGTDETSYIEKTSICPIPRPVSSVNMASLISQSSFPICLTPPPSPSMFQFRQSSPSMTDLPESNLLPTQIPPSSSYSAQFVPTSPSISQFPQPSPSMSQFPLTEVNTQYSSTPPLKLSGVYIQQGQHIGSLDLPPIPVACEETEVVPVALKRAISCDSVCSDTSVGLGDLEMLNITGYLCIGLEYDSECWDLVVNVLEAKELRGIVKKDDNLDTYVRVTLLPDKEATIQTKVYRSSGSPSYKERFLFSMNPREQSQRILSFHVYSTDFLSHTLVGDGEIRLSDVSLRQPVTTWVTLTDTGQKGTECGELLFSLSYLPTAERLTVVVVKTRNLKFSCDTPGEAFVKVYLMQQNKKINKKKTSVKRGEKCPIFNEAMMFSVPAHTLSTIQLRLTVAETTLDESSKAISIGHVIVGAQAIGRSLSHWNQMLTALRKPVAMWHSLRKHQSDDHAKPDT
ncbi:synaptotagmin-12-like isoform X1 [Diabrotica undecimpunctata]|uniref:synaptotagmin-12-like isoform X1 n=2 Tax=Diabrotica undecimpunctata TaxID=50387 RepID=UPI003B63E024